MEYANTKAERDSNQSVYAAIKEYTVKANTSTKGTKQNNPMKRAKKSSK